MVFRLLMFIVSIDFKLSIHRKILTDGQSKARVKREAEFQQS